VLALLNIDLLRPVQWTKDLFENLVLPTDEKDVLLALVRSHSKADVTFDDFVVGKGKPPSPIYAIQYQNKLTLVPQVKA
jgi:hypothetical protein